MTADDEGEANARRVLDLLRSSPLACVADQEAIRINTVFAPDRRIAPNLRKLMSEHWLTLADCLPWGSDDQAVLRAAAVALSALSTRIQASPAQVETSVAALAEEERAQAEGRRGSAGYAYRRHVAGVTREQQQERAQERARNAAEAEANRSEWGLEGTSPRPPVQPVPVRVPASRPAG